jgi:TPR repeat protein
MEIWRYGELLWKGERVDLDTAQAAHYYKLSVDERKAEGQFGSAHLVQLVRVSMWTRRRLPTATNCRRIRGGYSLILFPKFIGFSRYTVPASRSLFSNYEWFTTVRY